MLNPRAIATSFLLLLTALAVGAEQPAGEYLTIDRIFVNREFATKPLGATNWLPDSSGYLKVEPTEKDPKGDELVRYDVQTSTRTVLVSTSMLIPEGGKTPIGIEEYEISKDGKLLVIFTNSQRVWRRNTKGEYWLLNLTSGKLAKLGGKDDGPSLMFAKLSPIQTHVAYVRDNNIYVENVSTQAITQLTQDGSKNIINGTFDWVYEEEFSLRDGFRWSPDGQMIAFWQLDTAGVPEFTMINNTDALYPTTTTFAYPKVGQTIAAARIGVVPITGPTVRWMNVEGDPRAHYIASLEWAEKPMEVVFQRVNRAQNTNALTFADPATGQTRILLTEKDSAWVDTADKIHWLDAGMKLLWESERDGWKHIFSVDRGSGATTLITPQNYDAIDLVQVDEKGGWLYSIASPDNPTQRYLYRCRLDGNGAAQRLSPTSAPGTHSYRPSPDGRYAFHTISSFDNPPVTELVSLSDHKVIRTLIDNAELRAKLSNLKRRPTEFFRVNIGNGIILDGWCMKPTDLEPGTKYPVLINVYGEPAGQTVVDRFGGNGYLWHLMLNQHGYVVMSFDNRGTPAPRGREWRKSIFGKIGIISSEDQAAALKAVSQWPFVDPSRVAIWGWSGGGSMTLNCMFRYPELYKLGMSVASVPDQRLYDAIYQERYMGQLSENEEGYIKGSPITYADKLQGDLLILHGTGDDNVHYQGAERLANELIKAGKRFTLMAYPNRSHGINEGKGTTRHVYDLLTNYLETHMSPGPR